MKRIIYGIFSLLCAGRVSAQQTFADSNKLIISGYAEIYYGYDFNHPLNNTRPPFIYSYNRVNEITPNIAFIKAAYTSAYTRANAAIMAGTYTNANLSTEPGVLKNLLEANVGIKLLKSANLWLDAGVFSSHIGFEGVSGKDCWTLTRSIVADNSPYYESGAKISYTTNNGKLYISGLLLNGWQHINRPDGNTGMSGGLQITYQPTAAITLNYSNFYGNDKPDSARRERFYNDFYAIIKLNKQAGLIAGIDYAAEQSARGSSIYNDVIAPVMILRYAFTDSFAIAGRAEYYQDANGIFISTKTPNGFKTTGYSLNADYIPYKNVLIRIEGKYYNSKDPVFTSGSNQVSENEVLTTSISLAF